MGKVTPPVFTCEGGNLEKSTLGRTFCRCLRGELTAQNHLCLLGWKDNLVTTCKNFYGSY